MSTGLIAGQVNEESMAEIYAADGGIEDAIWRIQTRDENVPTADEPAPWSYDLSDELGLADELNDRENVSNTIEYII